MVTKANPANLLSLTRVFLAFAAVLFLLEIGGGTGTLVAICIIALAVLLDAVDGVVARTFGFEDEVGKLTDLYADHIVANTIWVTLAFLSLVSVWVPLITTTRDFAVDLFRQATIIRTGRNGFAQVARSCLRWVVASRAMRALYGGLKLAAWGLALLSDFVPAAISLQLVVWMTVAVCLFRAVPCLLASWKHIALARPAQSGR